MQSRRITKRLPTTNIEKKLLKETFLVTNRVILKYLTIVYEHQFRVKKNGPAAQDERTPKYLVIGNYISIIARVCM